MSAQYSRDHCKIAVGKILQTIGWHSINSTPLEVLTDIFSSYIQQISRITNDYTNEFGQTEVNLDHLGLAFQEMGIHLSELEEYVTYVNFAPPANPAPKFPVPKEDNLNFLKPGSKEVVTRPVYIHEHMPPMFPLLEGSDSKEEEEINPIKEECIDETYNSLTPFKKPSDISSPEFRKPKREDEGSRPTREISSVMMTTSGFLSPAREGKLPEAKAPIPPPVVELPVPPLVPTTQNSAETNAKKKNEKRKEKFSKELFKPIPEEKIAKKTATMKDVVKMKQKAAAAAAAAASNSPLSAQSATVSQPPLLPPRLNELKLSSIPPQKMRDNLDKALAAAKAKTEKLNTTITPVPIRAQSPSPQMTIQQVEKLINEPDRKKANILRKITNAKEGKIKKDSRANTPNLIIDEPSDIVNKISLSNDITIEPIPRTRTPDNHYFDNGSPPPGTPPTPRTPEIITHSPPISVPKEKRKRKDNRNKISRTKKQPKKNPHIPFFTDSELVDMIMERPKTPDVHHLNHLRQQLPPHMNIPSMHNPHIPFPFLANFGGPGLIPPQLSTPMFPFSHLGNIPNFGKNPYFPSVVPNLPPQIDPMPLVSPKVKEPPPPVEIKPVEIIPQRVQPPSPLQPIQVPETSSSTTPTPKSCLLQDLSLSPSPKKVKEHKKEKKDKIKKKNKKDKVKEKAEKKKIKELKKDSKVKREKKIKKKEKDVKEATEAPVEIPAIPKILLKVNSPSSRPETPEATRKLNIKPIVKKEEEPIVEDKKRDPSPGGLARISALVTGPPKPKTISSPQPPPVEKVAPEVIVSAAPIKPAGRQRLTPMKPKPPPKPKKIEQTFKKTDEQGNEVWICPACGQQDDGRPMIGCDGCDAWYHWVCVGIQVPPDENENWYCKPCLCRKNEDLQTDKKRKRKKKEKKDH